jgi:hypothetical protein
MLELNKFRRPYYLIPTLAAMASVLVSLSKDQHSGFLGQRLGLNKRGTIAIQYWSQAEGSDHCFGLHGFWAPLHQRALRSHGAVGFSQEIYQTRRIDTALEPLCGTRPSARAWVAQA